MPPLDDQGELVVPRPDDTLARLLRQREVEAQSSEDDAELQNLNAARGLTIVLVTHEPDIAAMTSRIVAMRDGSVRSDVPNRAKSADALLAEAATPDDARAPA